MTQNIPPDMEENVTQDSPPPAPPRRGWLHRLFSPETRTGRVLRPFLRVLGLVVGFFALGLLTAYLLLYRPSIQVVDASRAELQTSRQDLTTAREQLEQARAETDALRAENKELNAGLDAAEARIQALRVLKAVSQARAGLALKETDLVKDSFALAQKEMLLLAPYVRAQDPALATQLEARLTLAAAEYTSAPETANTDLKTLANTLIEFEKSLLE